MNRQPCQWCAENAEADEDSTLVPADASVTLISATLEGSVIERVTLCEGCARHARLTPDHHWEL